MAAFLFWLLLIMAVAIIAATAIFLSRRAAAHRASWRRWSFLQRSRMFAWRLFFGERPLRISHFKAERP